MSFSSFFTEQARKPKGLFGRVVMSVVFDIGNAKLNAGIFRVYSLADDRDLLSNSGFGPDPAVTSRKYGPSPVHCVTAEKRGQGQSL